MAPEPHPPDLERFVRAQDAVWEEVTQELAEGRKRTHWIWFVFPQVAGLGHSVPSQVYAIGSLAEARAYLAHPVLGERLRACAALLLAVRGRSAVEILGETDAMKLRSSMTLFHRADPDEPLFRAVMERYADGRPDDRTDAILRGDPDPGR